MDYPFLVAPIARVSADLVARLADAAQELQYDAFPSLQTLLHTDYHPHTEAFKAACMELHRHLGLFTDDQIVRFTVTKLRPGHVAAEHSDFYVQKGAPNNLAIINNQHKIHVPLITNPLAHSLHRRTQLLPHTAYHMPTGYAYAYNDVAWHKIVNAGAENRYHLIVFYKDPTQTVKRRIMDALSIDYHNFYEDLSYKYPFEHHVVRD